MKTASGPKKSNKKEKITYSFVICTLHQILTNSMEKTPSEANGILS
jgi:hypothetical protein